MKKIISVGIILFSLLANVFAEDSIYFAKAKFELIKNAVWFYSKDTITFKNTPSDCRTSKDYTKLEECAKGMKGVGENISEWKSSKVTDVEKLNKLNKKIIADITAKKHREIDFADDFKKFQKEAEKIIFNAVKESLKTIPEPTITPTPKKSSNYGNIPLWITLIIALIALIYSVLSRISLKSKIRKLKSEIQSIKESSENWNVAQRINSLEKEIKSFDGSMDELREEVSRKIKNLAVSQATSTPETTTQVQNKPIQEGKPATQIKYAKYADMGDGFSVGELSDEQDNEKIFEIVISQNNTAKFKIVSNRNAQLFALSNPNLYFNKICKYDSVPASNSNITTETEGDLKLQGNKWQIVNAAKINFA